MALSCWVVPFAMLGLVGVTAMDTSFAAVTVRVVKLEIAPMVAVMVVVPVAALVAMPLLPEALEMVATEFFFDDQVTVAVTSWFVLSE